MTDPTAETHRCYRCQTFRARSATGLCPVCADLERIAERAARKPPP